MDVFQKNKALFLDQIPPLRVNYNEGLVLERELFRFVLAFFSIPHPRSGGCLNFLLALCNL
jgi:hypothetical protein